MSGKRYQGAPRATSPKSIRVPTAPEEVYDPSSFDDLKFADKFQVLMQARNAFSNPIFIDNLEVKLADLLEVREAQLTNKLLVPEIKVQVKP